jgi:hypothetical protein
MPILKSGRAVAIHVQDFTDYADFDDNGQLAAVRRPFWL